MRRSASTLVALVLLIMLTLAIATVAYSWVASIQSDAQAGAARYQSELSEQVVGEIKIESIEHKPLISAINLVVQNLGTRELKELGSSKDLLTISSQDFSCTAAFNGSNCAACPFNLGVGEVKSIVLDLGGTECENVEPSKTYAAYLAFGDTRAATSFRSGAQHNQWAKKEPASRPCGRSYHAMAQIDGTSWIVLFGGVSESGYGFSGDTWLYNERSGWGNQTFPATPSTYYQAPAMARIDGTSKALLFGGYNGSRYSRETWIYNHSDGAWTKKSITPRPTAREAHAMAAVDGTSKIVLFGGYNVSINAETWIYNHSDNTWTQMSPAASPSARYAHAMATIGGTDRVLLFGGYDSSSLADTWVYDLSDNTWTSVGPARAPSARSQHAMTDIYGTDKVLLFGGTGNTGAETDLWRYDASSESWSRAHPSGDAPAGRYSHSIAGVYNSQKVVLFGGIITPDLVYGNETWVYE